MENGTYPQFMPFHQINSKMFISFYFLQAKGGRFSRFNSVERYFLLKYGDRSYILTIFGWHVLYSASNVLISVRIFQGNVFKRLFKSNSS